MKNKKIIYFSLAVLLLAIGLTALFLTRDDEDDPSLTRQEMAQRRQIVLDSLHHMQTIKKAIALVYKNERVSLPTTDILLEEIVKLADMDLSNGQWDDLGVYTTEYFIYVGGCYSTWCYAEANRKDNAYSLLIRHDGKKWVTQACATQNTELGRTVCQRLKKRGWHYQEGEI